MTLYYRRIETGDVDALFDVRANTRQNPISRERLAGVGVTPRSMIDGFNAGDFCGWVSVSEHRIVGFCAGLFETGEVLALAVLPDHEGQGAGKQLLGGVVDDLQVNGATRIWLSADSNATVRAHGFYRRLGWLPTGEVLENGDEILALSGSPE
jgi:ribosomal protein S18 acetylase RimI-like enzyme